MTAVVNVVRFYLVDWFNYLVIPWAVLAFSLAVNLVIFAAIGGGPQQHRTGGFVTVYVLLLVGGLFTVTRFLPFGLALGLSRRSYYLGTLAFALGIAVTFGLGFAVLQAIERGTGGWGEHVNYFRVKWILDGPWYQTWLTSSVVVALVFTYGIWFGLIYRRWSLTGAVLAAAAQISVLVAVVLVTTWTHTWHHLGHVLAGLSAIGTTGGLAALTVLLCAAGCATMRRVSV